MSVYMISYDLNSPTNNRDDVEEAIKSLGTWCKYVSTTFLVKTSHTSETVQSIATRPLDNNDRMIIAKVEKPILGWLDKEHWTWINQNL